MLHTVVSWWLDLLIHHGLIGPVIAVVLLAFVVLAVGNAVIWPLAGLRWLTGRERRRAALTDRRP